MVKQDIIDLYKKGYSIKYMSNEVFRDFNNTFKFSDYKFFTNSEKRWRCREFVESTVLEYIHRT